LFSVAFEILVGRGEVLFVDRAPLELLFKDFCGVVEVVCCDTFVVDEKGCAGLEVCFVTGLSGLPQYVQKLAISDLHSLPHAEQYTILPTCSVLLLDFFFDKPLN
jgi:hypothetical protein